MNERQKLIVFDLDGTLAALGEGIAPEVIDALRSLEARGHRIALCSGKSAYYLCGFLRQVGLKHPIMVGENGAETLFGVDLPPKEHFTLPVSASAERSIRLLREAIHRRAPEIWFQPNCVVLTAFYGTQAQHDLIRRTLDDCAAELHDVDVYEHCDSFDVVPKGISKFAGLKALGARLGIGPQDTIAVGDGVNDLPMFEYAGFSIGIRMAHAQVDRRVQSIQEAMDYLLANT